MKQKPSLNITQQGDTFELTFQGAWVKESLAELDKTLQSISYNANSHYTFQLGTITNFDTHGIMYILHLRTTLQNNHSEVTLQGASESLTKLINVCQINYPQEFPKPPDRKSVV